MTGFPFPCHCAGIGDQYSSATIPVSSAHIQKCKIYKEQDCSLNDSKHLKSYSELSVHKRFSTKGKKTSFTLFEPNVHLGCHREGLRIVVCKFWIYYKRLPILIELEIEFYNDYE